MYNKTNVTNIQRDHVAQVQVASGSPLRPTGTAWTCSPWPTTRTSATSWTPDRQIHAYCAGRGAVPAPRV